MEVIEGTLSMSRSFLFCLDGPAEVGVFVREVIDIQSDTGSD